MCPIYNNIADLPNNLYNTTCDFHRMLLILHECGISWRTSRQQNMPVKTCSRAEIRGYKKREITSGRKKLGSRLFRNL